MKKRVFAVMAAVLFIGSTLSATTTSANYESNIIFSDDCRDFSFGFMDYLFDEGYTDVGLVTCAGNVAYARCEGYDVGFDQCF